MAKIEKSLDFSKIKAFAFDVDGVFTVTAASCATWQENYIALLIPRTVSESAWRQ